MRKLTQRLTLSLSIAMILAFTVAANYQTFVDLTLHYVEGTPASDGTSFAVSAFLSVVDGNGIPIRDLQAADFRVIEGSRDMEVSALTAASNEPSNILLLIDTSGSMAQKMPAAISAADKFIAGLGLNDQVGVISFNERISEVVEQTSNLQLARQRLQTINAVNNAGTCLYNAAYEAVNKASALPPGRRAVIILTDGKDELLQGGPCSQLTTDDVISQATTGTQIPIYTIGLGSDIDQKVLERISTLTGGGSLFSATEQNLEDLFGRLLDQLRSQYLLTYRSTNPPGVVSVSVEVDVRGAKAQDKLTYVLPALPTRIQIISPTEGQQIKEDSLHVDVQLIGQGEPVSQVVIQANDQVIGSISQAPYSLDWDVSDLEPGTEIKIEAIAQGSNFQELARQEVVAQVYDPASPVQSQDESGEETEDASSTFALPGIEWILGGLGLIVLGIVAIFLLRKRKSTSESSEEFGTMELDSVSGNQASLSDATIDDFGAIGEIFGILTVLHSDDEAMVGKQFNLMKTSTKLGRNPDNDIVLTDKPISRFHVTITTKDGRAYLSEVVSKDPSGKVKRPTYGTFINGSQVKKEVELGSGDEIGLGTRAKLRYESIVSINSNDDKTIDDIDLSDSDKTREV